MSKRQDVRVGRKLVGIVDDGWWEGGREENSLDVLWQKAGKMSTTSAIRVGILTT
jgi:hypothetical protein